MSLALAPTSPTVDDLTRRELLAGATALLVASACGGEEVARTDPAPPRSRSVTHEFGTFEVPLEPKRLVILEGRVDLESALALGLAPIAVGENAFDDAGKIAPWIEWDAAGVTEIGQLDNLNLEQLAALDPDLLIGRSLNIVDVQAELSAIAPLLPVETADAWRDILRRLAGWLGRERQAEQAIAGYEAERDRVAARHPEALARAAVALVQPLGDGTVIGGRTTSLYLQLRTLADLGGRQIPFLEEQLAPTDEKGSLTYSTERLGELGGADALLLVDNEGSSAVLDANPLWQQLPAVEDGRLLKVDGRLNQGSVFAAQECLRVLDQLYGLVERGV